MTKRIPNLDKLLGNRGIADRVGRAVQGRGRVALEPGVRTSAPGTSSSSGAAAPADTTLPTPDEGPVLGTDIFVFRTKPQGQNLLYSAPNKWVKVTMLLQNAGPVDYSTRQSIVPVGSGLGGTLLTNIPVNITLGPSDRIYVAATAVNRVTVTVESYPWLQEILFTIREIFRK